MQTPVYQKLAYIIKAIENCRKTGNTEWMVRHADSIVSIVRENLPSGSGFDSGTELILCESSSDKLHFRTAFHHMDDGGSYDGWTHHDVIVRPSLWNDFRIRVTGRNRNDIKEYIAETFNESLTRSI